MSNYSPPPKRDKFAALAAQQQQQQQPTKQVLNPDERSTNLPPNTSLFVPEGNFHQTSSNHLGTNNIIDPAKPGSYEGHTSYSRNTQGPTDLSSELAGKHGVQTVPKRDKFASLAAKTGTQQQNLVTVPIGMSSKSDKITSFAAVSNVTPTVETKHDSTVKRDKFASLAARSPGALSSDTSIQTAASQSANNAFSPTPKRDKFSSLASRGAVGSDVTTINIVAPKRDKFAALASAVSGSSTDVVSHGIIAAPEALRQEEQDVAKEEQQRLFALCQQRDSVWNDLDLAEARAMHLLQLAEKTTTSLADMTFCVNDNEVNNGMELLQTMQSDYMTTVSEIHSLLKPHAEFVKAYQPPARVNRMYLQRVELRIAESKRSILEELLRLQQLEGQDKSFQDRGDGVVATNEDDRKPEAIDYKTSHNDDTDQTNTQTNTSKRKRDSLSNHVCD
jgi:hypothetical protein